MSLYWKRKKANLRQKFTQIKNSDLKYSLGKEILMLRKLEDKLGLSEEEILNIIVES